MKQREEMKLGKQKIYMICLGIVMNGLWRPTLLIFVLIEGEIAEVMEMNILLLIVATTFQLILFGSVSSRPVLYIK